MDGKGHAIDNVSVERLLRSMKYEGVCLKAYETVADLFKGLTRYFEYYSHRRPHQSLGGKTPHSVYKQAV